MSNSKPQKLLIITVITIILIIIIYLISNIINNPTEIIKTTINNFYNNISKQLQNIDNNIINYKLKEDSLKLSSNIDLKGKLFNIDNTTLSLNAGLDLKNKQANLKGIIKEKENTLLDGNLYFQNNHLYLSSTKSLDNIYEIADFPFETLQISDIDFNFQDLDYVIKEFKDALISSLNPKYLTKKRTTITINNTNISVNSYNYNLEESSLHELDNNIIDKLTANDEFLNKIASLTGENANDIKENLLASKNATYVNNRTTFTIYTQKFTNKFIGASLKDSNEEVSYYNYNNQINIIAKTNNEELYRISIEKEGNNYLINTYENNEPLSKITIKEYNSKTLSLDYLLNSKDIKISGSLTLTNNKESNQKQTGKINLFIDEVDNQKYNSQINVDYTLEISPINSIDTSNSLNIKNITSEDQIKSEKSFMEFQNSEIYHSLTNSFSAFLF